MDYLYLIFAIAVFIAVVLLVEGIYSSWNSHYGPEAKRIAKRMKVMTDSSHASRPDVSILKERLLSKSPAIHQLLQQIPRIRSLDRLLEQSGLNLNVAMFLAISLVCGALTYIALIFTRLPITITLPISLIATGIPYLYVCRKKVMRLKKIEEQLPDALDLMGRAMRAGHAFPSALQMVGEEMAEPIAGEFQIVFDEVNFGITLQEALKNLTIRVPSTDLNYFVVAVLIQRETGGNLAELLDSIAAIIRARFRLYGQIRVLTAEGRLSAWILCLLPFALAIILAILNPKYMKILWTDPSGIKMLAIVSILMIVGIFWMRRLIRIRV